MASKQSQMDDQICFLIKQILENKNKMEMTKRPQFPPRYMALFKFQKKRDKTLISVASDLQLCPEHTSEVGCRYDQGESVVKQLGKEIFSPGERKYSALEKTLRKKILSP